LPRKLFKKYFPNPQKIKGLGFISQWLHTSDVWHLNRSSVCRSFFIGLFWMAIPIPSQMITAALSAILFRANLPISIALVWLSNPFTMPPIFYFNYIIGSWFLGNSPIDAIVFELSWNWIIHTLGELWLPLYLGSVIVGITIGTLGYFGVSLFWRWHVVQRWQARRKKTK